MITMEKSKRLDRPTRHELKPASPVCQLWEHNLSAAGGALNFDPKDDDFVQIWETTSSWLPNAEAFYTVGNVQSGLAREQNPLKVFWKPDIDFG